MRQRLGPLWGGIVAINRNINPTGVAANPECLSNKRSLPRCPLGIARGPFRLSRGNRPRDAALSGLAHRRSNFCSIWQLGSTKPRLPPADWTTSPT